VQPVLIFFLALLGLLAGPTLHHVAVQVGARRPIKGLLGPCDCGNRVLRCRSCGVRGRVAATSLTASAVLAGTGWVIGWNPVLPGYVVFALVTLMLVITDLDHKLIPNKILYRGGGLAIALLAIGSVADSMAEGLLRAFGGGFAYFGVLFLVAVIARGGFGFGDVKLAALLGMFTAYISIRVFLISVFFTGVFGGVPAIVLLITRRARAGDELPYGPAMVAGSWTALAFGEVFLAWYGA